MLLKYTQIFKLNSADFTDNGDIKLSKALDLFQTVATNHAEQIGAGFDKMLKNDIAWVLVKTRLTIVGKANGEDNVKVVTYPHPKGRIGYVRDYLIFDEKENLIIKGSSLWTLVSFSQRKLLRPTFDYEGEYVNEKAYEDDFIRFTPLMSQNNEYVYLILETDIDRNMHTNNVKYADFIINGLKNQPKIKEFSIQYSSETKLNDEILISYLIQEGEIKICGTSNGKNIFNALITN